VSALFYILRIVFCEESALILLSRNVFLRPNVFYMPLLGHIENALGFSRDSIP